MRATQAGAVYKASSVTGVNVGGTSRPKASLGDVMAFSGASPAPTPRSCAAARCQQHQLRRT